MKDKMVLKKNGLTLVEVLVVVAILGIIIVSLYTVFKSGADAWSKSKDRLEVFQNARIVMDQLSRELLCAFVGNDATFTGEGGTGPNNSDELEFVTSLGDTIYKLKYEIVANNVLQRKYIKEPPVYTSEDYEIVDFAFKIYRINFRYWNPDPDGNPDTDDAGWTIDGTWSETTLPDAVKIILECIDLEGKFYPYETRITIPSY